MRCGLAQATEMNTTSTSSTTAASLDHLRDWIGRSEQHEDTVTAAPLAGLSATLDRLEDPAPIDGTPVPPLAHWLYFLPQAPAHEIGADGHPKRGGFLPPVPLPRRMWAGGRLTFSHPIRVGEKITRRSTIASVEAKHGRSGALVFVTVRHEISNALGLAIAEEHDIVYRDNPEPRAALASSAPAPAPTAAMAPIDEQFSREVVPDPVLLFRYSALTFNGHRIHYDRSYVTEVEGYPGLIVHGPLIATLLVDLLRCEMPGATLKRFEFKAASPLFDIHPFTVCGKREDEGGAVALWARNHLGQLAMTARAIID
jgi:3-methylfumaryl-CoA hydratase